MSKNDGGPAFPIPYATDMDGYVYAPRADGMSLRDYFAGMALEWGVSSVLARPYLVPQSDEGYKALAEFSYRIADAMLAEREKRDDESR